MARPPATPSTPRAVLPSRGSLLDRVREAARLGLPEALIGLSLGYDPDLWAATLEEGKASIARGDTDNDPAHVQTAAHVVANIRIGTAEHQAQLISAIATSPDWKAAAWLLERIHGYKTSTKAEGDTTLRLDPLAVRDLAVDALEALAARAPKAAG